MHRLSLAIAATAASLASALPADAPPPQVPATPDAVIAAAPASDWRRISRYELLVMDLTPDAKGAPRRVVIQLVPAPFSQKWVDNIRQLVSERWYDGLAVTRVQDDYVVQWGDPDADDKTKAKPLPRFIKAVPESDYTSPAVTKNPLRNPKTGWTNAIVDPYAMTQFWDGWPLGRDSGVSLDKGPRNWPIHCYGTVGVGRDFSPDTGTGAELYAVIGQAPRQLDRNIAVVGRVISGIEYLSSLPRGTGPSGFYKTPEEYTRIKQVRLGVEVRDLPEYEYLSTDSPSFGAYLNRRANRMDKFFIEAAGGVDACNVPVPIRTVKK